MLPARALVAGALVSVFLVSATSAVAQESSTTTSSTTTSTSTPATTTTVAPAPTSAPRPDPDAFAALANQVSQNQQMLTQLSAQVDEAAQRLAALTTEIDATQQKRDATRTEMARLRGIVRERAAYIYRHADTPSTAVADVQHVQDISAAKKYAESATQTDTGKVDGLEKVSNQLDAQRRQLEDARASQQEEKDRLENAKEALEALTAHQKKLLDQAGAIPVMGDAELTAAEITGWFEARNVKYGNFVAPGNALRVEVDFFKATETGAIFKAAGIVNATQALSARIELSYFNLAEKLPELTGLDQILIDHTKARWSVLHNGKEEGISL